MPDFWIKMLRDKRDEEWNLGQLWHELTQRRSKEKVIGYCESHDQALVGDKTIMFWLVDKEMYWHMNNGSQSHIIDRAMALHKMIRLITCTCAGEGYLNFMGNEFGHPEWIDFPHEGNGNSYYYARRRWDLADDTNLRYHYLQNFDRAMIHLVKENNLLARETKLLLHDEENEILVYLKGQYLCAFNFHPHKNYVASIQMDKQINYQLVLFSECKEFGGQRDFDYRISMIPSSVHDKAQLKIPIGNRTAAIYTT